MMKNYRNTGAIGALLDEYEKSLIELDILLTRVTDENLIAIVDPTTTDVDCKSIQTILTHTIRAGYNYSVEIRNYLGEETAFFEFDKFTTIQQYRTELKKMFLYNEQLFNAYPSLPLEEYDASKKMRVRWGQAYDIEQLLEHAIVHILRHRRQIERFLIILNR